MWCARKLIEYLFRMVEDNGLDYMVVFNQFCLVQVELVDGNQSLANDLFIVVWYVFETMGYVDELVEVYWVTVQVAYEWGELIFVEFSVAYVMEYGSLEIRVRVQIIYVCVLCNSVFSKASKAVFEVVDVLLVLGQCDGVVEAMVEDVFVVCVMGQRQDLQ